MDVNIGTVVETEIDVDFVTIKDLVNVGLQGMIERFF
jgi:hypothetical protein